MSWRQFLKTTPEVLRVQRVQSPPDMTLPTLKTLLTPKIEIKNISVSPIPQWQHDFCLAHAMFNNWQGQCPYSIDECLISKIIEAGNCIEKMRGLDLGQGITTDMVIDEWLDTGEPAEELFRKPVSFICMAAYLANGDNH